jgi:hypothetical protein
MGRLTLNVLLSFAQFEREVTSERIRDKIAASKRKGLWVGGPLPLGYELKDGKLVVVEEEADRVRMIFRRYLEVSGINELVRDLRAKDICTKNLWPKLAAAFDMPVGDVQAISLTAHMVDNASLWRAMTEKYGLKPHAYDELVAWLFADYVFGCDWGVMSDVTKSRRFGFQDLVDSEEMFVRLMREFRAERIVP